MNINENWTCLKVQNCKCGQVTREAKTFNSFCSGNGKPHWSEMHSTLWVDIAATIVNALWYFCCCCSHYYETNEPHTHNTKSVSSFFSFERMPPSIYFNLINTSYLTGNLIFLRPKFAIFQSLISIVVCTCVCFELAFCIFVCVCVCLCMSSVLAHPFGRFLRILLTFYFVSWLCVGSHFSFILVIGFVLWHTTVCATKKKETFIIVHG